MNKEKLQVFGQGAAVGAIVLAIGMFWSGVAVTSGSANEMARDTARTAVVEHLAPICVAQFTMAGDTQRLRADLEAEKSSWNRTAFVKTKGWATMPGSDKPRDDIARACADLILNSGI